MAGAHPSSGGCPSLLWRVSIPLVVGAHPSCGGCPSLLWRVPIPLVAGAHPSCGGCPSLLWRVSIPLVAGAHPSCGGYPSLLWRVSIPLVAGAHPCCGGCPSLLWQVPIPLVAGAHPSCGGYPSLLWRTVSIPLVVGSYWSMGQQCFFYAIHHFMRKSMATFELYALWANARQFYLGPRLPVVCTMFILVVNGRHLHNVRLRSEPTELPIL